MTTIDPATTTDVFTHCLPLPASTTPTRQRSYAQAIHEALSLALEHDPRVYLVGEGTPDVKGVFGTTLGLVEKFGRTRVREMPVAENGMTGVAIGAALAGMRPVLTHQRMDFALLSIDQLVNNAAKWHAMFGGQQTVPLVIRMIIGRGWGQGPQHSQSLQAWLAHVPGLRVVMPATPHDAKGLLLASIADDHPVMFLEHRWLHGVSGPVPEGAYKVPLGNARVARRGSDVSLVCTSYMTLEALRASAWLAEDGIDAEVIDVRSLRPLDVETITTSVRKTGRLIATDTGWGFCGFAAELALAAEQCHSQLRSPPRRVCLPNYNPSTSHAAAQHYYPRAADLYRTACELVGRLPREVEQARTSTQLDVPDPSFQGPF